ncbi:MAG: N-acetylmuramoyl-L-alanine amidase [Oscillospiraceae bacterium]|nr:N-acetylmuramoyl-L-alanine amidase [Oscillospiraceae bacterium]
MSNLNIINDLIPAGRRNRPAKANPMKFITIHETGNTSRGANAKAHASYLRGDAAAGIPISWHYTVDDGEIRQHLPENETAFHAGDGANGVGNSQSIGIEICVNSDGDFAKAVNQTIALVADICYRRNIAPENIAQHNRWNGKNCPQNLRAGRPFSWNEFVNRIRAVLETLKAANSKPVSPNSPTVSANPPASGKTTFRVVAGSFANRANAEAQVRRLKSSGFDSFIVEHKI